MRKLIIITVLTAFMALLAWAYLAWSYSIDNRSEKAHGVYLVSELRSRNPQGTFYWVPGRRSVEISIYGLTTTAAQDGITQQVREMQESRADGIEVVLHFFERENWIDSSGLSLENRTGRRGPETLLRTVVVTSSVP